MVFLKGGNDENGWFLNKIAASSGIEEEWRVSILAELEGKRFPTEKALEDAIEQARMNAGLKGAMDAFNSA